MYLLAFHEIVMRLFYYSQFLVSIAEIKFIIHIRKYGPAPFNQNGKPQLTS